MGLWCLTPISTIFQLYCGVSFIGGRNRSIRRKPPIYASIFLFVYLFQNFKILGIVFCWLLATLPWLKCSTTIKAPFLYLNLCLSVKLGRLLCSLASIWLSISFLLLMCHEQNKTHTQQNQTSNKLIYNSYNTNGPSWPWSYGSWIHSYLCNQCLSPLMLWVRISIRARCTTLCDKVC